MKPYKITIYRIFVLSALALIYSSSSLCLSQNSNNKLTSLLDKAFYFKYLNDDSCMYYSDKAYPIAISSKNIEAEADILLLKSRALSNKRLNSEAMELLQQAKNIAQRTGNRLILARVLGTEANVYMAMENYDESYNSVMSALSIYNSINSKKDLASIYNSIGLSNYVIQRNYEEALSNYKKAEEYALSVKDSTFLILIRCNMASAYIDQGMYHEANTLLNSCIKDISDKNIPFNLYKVYVGLSYSYISAYKPDTAIFYAQKAYEYSIANKNSHDIANVLYHTGVIFALQKGKEEFAIDYFEQADSLATKLGILGFHQILCGEKARLLERLGKYKEAYQCMIAYMAASDSLNIQNQLSNLKRIRYEYEHKQMLTTVSFKETQRLILFISLTIVLLFVIFSILLLYSRQKLRLKNAKLEQYRLNMSLEESTKDITTKLLFLQQKNNIIEEIIDKLIKSKHLPKPQYQTTIEESVKQLRQCINDDSWEEFELRFGNIHVDFFKKLNDLCPGLSQNEKRLCAYLKLNMTSKEIATLINTSISGVEQARFRLRKKLGLNNSNQDLFSFIDSI